jgi:hypothetical protein
MNWEIKKIENKRDFDELENFYRNKFPKFYHKKLSSNYLYWKLKKNNKFNGVMIVAVKNHEIIGSLSLTFKSTIFNHKKNYVAEIGDSYVDFKAQKSLTIKKKLLNEKNFEKRSIFGSLVSHILKIAKEKNIDFIYGVPNNTSLQGYTKKLNFKTIDKFNMFSYILPNLKTSNGKINYFTFLNYILKFYRFLLLKINYRKLSFSIEENFSSEEVKSISKKKKNSYILIKDEQYFSEKYKFNPEDNFKFCKIYKNSDFIGVFVIKEDFLNQKIYIVDCLCSVKTKYLIKYVLLVINSHYNLSVSFWDKSANISTLTRFIYTIFKRKKINIIYFNDINFDQYSFFNEFYLGHSDCF